MSAFPKILWQITIDSTNQTFGFDDGGGALTADITAGDHDTILEVVDNLVDAMTTASAGQSGVTFTGAVSSTGTVTITGDASWTWTEGTTDDDLEALLGLDGTETVSSDVLTSTSAHTHGWYPGTTSFGSTSGACATSDSDWYPEWPTSDSVSGSGKMRRIAPSRGRWLRTLAWDLLTDDEALDVDRGCQAVARAWAVPLRYYPDRDVGTVATPGTQADPHDDPDDDNADYWKIYLLDVPEWRTHSQSGAYRSFSMVVHGEPD